MVYNKNYVRSRLKCDVTTIKKKKKKRVFRFRKLKKLWNFFCDSIIAQPTYNNKYTSILSNIPNSPKWILHVWCVWHGLKYDLFIIKLFVTVGAGIFSQTSRSYSIYQRIWRYDEPNQLHTDRAVIPLH